MALLKLVSNQSMYNEWANLKMIDWLKTVNDEILLQKTTSSFETIDKTIQHITQAQEFWLHFISIGNPEQFNWSFKDQEIVTTLQDFSISSNKVKNVVTNYSESELIEQLSLDQPWCKNNLSRYEYILHVLNHTIFHRGQIVSMARMLGYKEAIPNTGYNFYISN